MDNEHPIALSQSLVRGLHRDDTMERESLRSRQATPERLARAFAHFYLFIYLFFFFFFGVAEVERSRSRSPTLKSTQPSVWKGIATHGQESWSFRGCRGLWNEFEDVDEYWKVCGQSSLERTHKYMDQQSDHKRVALHIALQLHSVFERCDVEISVTMIF